MPPQIYIDGDGCPARVKEITFRVAQRDRADVTIVANRPLMIPRHRRLKSVVVPGGMDVADAWIVDHAVAGDLVVTSDVPLAAELAAKGVLVVTARGEIIDASNAGEKLSLRDFATEARASGIMEGGGPPPFDERAARRFADALNAWVGRLGQARAQGSTG